MLGSWSKSKCLTIIWNSQKLSDSQSEIDIAHDTSEGAPEVEIEYSSNHYNSVLQLANKLKKEESKRNQVVPRYQQPTFSIERKKNKKKVWLSWLLFRTSHTMKLFYTRMKNSSSIDISRETSIIPIYME